MYVFLTYRIIEYSDIKLRAPWKQREDEILSPFIFHHFELIRKSV